MKRKWSMVLVLCLFVHLLCVPTLAAEEQGVFPDIPAGADYAEAVEELYNKGILYGDAQGNFNPESTITRGEVAAMVCRMLGAEEEAGWVEHAQFEDVSIAHWANGYIVTAANYGIVNGYGNGNFGPGDAVTYVQILKMLVCILGHEQEAMEQGGYPNGYLAVADELGIALDTIDVAETPVPRKTVAVLFARAIHAEAYEHIHEVLTDSLFYDLDDTQALEPYYKMADQRKEAILNSPTEIVKAEEFIPGKTYTGTAYYISPNGDDDNDGLTPETAWKTPERTNWGTVREGDAVFFERGGVYPLQSKTVLMISKVTYSAYGEGAKPVITLAQENSARTECWELWQEGKNGEKIWRYYEPLAQVSGVIFDDTTYATPVFEWPTAEGWLALDIKEMDPANGICAPEDPCSSYWVTSAGEYRTVEEQLTEDLTYLWRVDLEGASYPIDLSAEAYSAGELLLRCDGGNPGECYDHIAVTSLQRDEWGDIYDSLFDGNHADGWVLDNLAMKYFSVHAVGSNNTSGKGAVIQNCTLEWQGNYIGRAYSAEPTNNYSLFGDDGVYCVSNQATFRNNYVRHCGNAFTFEGNWEEAIYLGFYRVEGNLIENCGQGIRTYFIEDRYENAFDELVLRDNIILNSGDSLNKACWEEAVALDLGYADVQYAKHIEIADNVVLGGTTALIRLPDDQTVEIDFHGNVFAQSREGWLMTQFSQGTPDWYKMKDAMK